MDAISCLPPPALLMPGSGSSSSLADARALHYSLAYDSVLLAHSPPPAARRQQHKHQLLAPAGGRAGKRRSRASKRAPTTYINTDPANFRIMVQQITGAADHDMLLAAGTPLLMPPAADEASAPLHHNQHHLQLQQPCFPTLDSWNVMYDRTDLL